MVFGPFALYRYEGSPTGNHSIWGEHAWNHGLDQFAALAETMEGLRREFISSILVVTGVNPAVFSKDLHVGLDGRFGVSEHNGVLIDHPGAPSWLVDASRSTPMDFSSLVSEVGQNRGSAAALFSREPVVLETVSAEFNRAQDKFALRANLLRLTLVYLGFDHDAFFTLETRDSGIMNDVLQWGKVPSPRHK